MSTLLDKFLRQYFPKELRGDLLRTVEWFCGSAFLRQVISRFFSRYLLVEKAFVSGGNDFQGVLEIKSVSETMVLG